MRKILIGKTYLGKEYNYIIWWLWLLVWLWFKENLPLILAKSHDSGQKMLAHARPMTWLAHICVCNFWVGSGFFKFRVKYFGPYPTRDLVRSGFFFRAGRIRFIGSGGPWSGLGATYFVILPFIWLAFLRTNAKRIIFIDNYWFHDWTNATLLLYVVDHSVKPYVFTWSFI